MSYADQLKMTGWQRRRLIIMNRDGWRCTACGEHGDEIVLNVHHRWYPNRGMKPWEVPDEALTTLCERCHEATHFPGDMPLDHLTDAELRDFLHTSIADDEAAPSAKVREYQAAKQAQAWRLLFERKRHVVQG